MSQESWYWPCSYSEKYFVSWNATTLASLVSTMNSADSTRSAEHYICKNRSKNVVVKHIFSFNVNLYLLYFIKRCQNTKYCFSWETLYFSISKFYSYQFTINTFSYSPIPVGVMLWSCYFGNQLIHQPGLLELLPGLQYLNDNFIRGGGRDYQLLRQPFLWRFC